MVPRCLLIGSMHSVSDSICTLGMQFVCMNLTARRLLLGAENFQEMYNGDILPYNMLEL